MLGYDRGVLKQPANSGGITQGKNTKPFTKFLANYCLTVTRQGHELCVHVWTYSVSHGWIRGWEEGAGGALQEKLLLQPPHIWAGPSLNPQPWEVGRGGTHSLSISTKHQILAPVNYFCLAASNVPIVLFRLRPIRTSPLCYQLLS